MSEDVHVWGTLRRLRRKLPALRPTTVARRCQVCFDIDDSEKHTNYITEQYPGLKDKNGKEIYEGDILGLKGEDANPFVVFQDGGYRGKYTSAISMIMTQHEISYVGWKVIGNIHENPELLEKKE